ncbi:M23 family metallopeptidase [Thiomicrospira sp. ALE5]|uniref:M23 family metallopeptidase n=1 Tax=Thiomicrospira sp. ALE5 TaxID=748650 RepID=UPI00135663A1|nr:M23 family metallopeptidase [Thiomicrospira sp. ALE5]
MLNRLSFAKISTITVLTALSLSAQAVDFNCPLTDCSNISAPYNQERKPSHNGIDFAVPVGSEVFAPADGVIKIVSQSHSAGQYIVMSHKNSYETLYLHLQNSLVEVGQKVKSGQVIAKTGATGIVTGPVLHWEVRKNNQPQEPSFAH